VDTPRLTDALKKLDEHVNAADVEEEDRLIKNEEAAQEKSDRALESLHAFFRDQANAPLALRLQNIPGE
jgi:ATP phosphoribosyltransferase regulatory subunit HisZ